MCCDIDSLYSTIDGTCIPLINDDIYVNIMLEHVVPSDMYHTRESMHLDFLILEMISNALEQNIWSFFFFY